MTVTATAIVPLIYTGTNTTDTYVYNFTLYQDADLVVEEILIATGAKTTLTLDAVSSGYEVEKDVDGNRTGNIILSDGNLPTTKKLVVYPSYTKDQQTDYTSFGPLPSATHETGLDKLTLICQQLQEQIDRCVKVSIESGETDPTSDEIIEDMNTILTNCQTSETNAAASEAAAATSETNAAASETAAAASAASINTPTLASGDPEKLLQVNATYDGYDLLTKATLQAEIGVPAGGYIPFGASTAPSGWLLCDGSAVSRTTYAALFAAIGTSYGVGNGSTTFNVPDMRGRVALGLDNLGGSSANRVTSAQADSIAGSAGAEDHALTEAELASHDHSYTLPQGSSGSGGGESDRFKFTAGATTGTAGSGNAHNNMQPYLTGGYIIKY